MEEIARLLMVALLMCDPALKSKPGYVDPLIIVKLESDGNPRAFNKKTKATGLFQITPVVVEGYNRRFQKKLTLEQMTDIKKSVEVAYWYLEERIPQMLRFYNYPVTTQRILWCWHAGIGNFLNGIMPDATRKFINRYNKIAREKENEWK